METVSAAKPPSASYAPMLATSGPLPANGRPFAFEFKWDGVRCILYASQGKVRLLSRSGSDITSRYPELHDVGRSLGERSAVLDGEIVALNETARPSFAVLQERMHEAQPSPTLLNRVPVTFLAFDILELDGKPLLSQPYRARRQALESLGFAGQHWLTAPSHEGDGEAVLEASRSHDLEGIVAKALESPYRPGVRSDAWIKIKNRHRQEFVIGGWTQGEGVRSLTFGALLLGHYEGDGDGRRLVYAGRVGTGFNDAATARLESAMRPLRRATSPFAGALPPGKPIYVEPRLVAEVEFGEWTPDGLLRHASFLGLRADKDPSMIERESTRIHKR